MFRLTSIAVMAAFFAVPASADPHWGHGHHHGHHHRHEHGYYPYVEERIVYVPAAPRYYAPPPPPPVANYYRYDQRSTQGLVGGMVGGAVGYEMGRGDPLATGIGAAAGALLGNGFY